MSDTADTLAVIRTYDQLRAAIAGRRKELGFAQRDFDQVTGLPDGYQGKLECGLRSVGGLSLGLVLEALGVELVMQRRAA